MTLVLANAEYVQQLNGASAIEPLDPRDYPAFDDFFPEFQRFLGHWQDGKLYAVAIRYGFLGVAYNTQALSEREASNYDVFWSLNHPELGLVFDIDKQAGARSRTNSVGLAASKRLLVAGSHVPFPGLGHVAKDGRGHAIVPAQWDHTLWPQDRPRRCSGIRAGKIGIRMKRRQPR